RRRRRAHAARPRRRLGADPGELCRDRRRRDGLTQVVHRRRGSSSTTTRKENPMKLHVAPPSPRAIRVLAVAHHLGLDPDVVPVDLVGGDQRKPAFRALNPNGKMPVLEDDGFVLWESNAIMQYLAAKAGDRALWPSEPRRQADVSRWQCWELAHWGPAAGTLVFERFVKALFGQGGPTPSEVERGEREFHQYAAVLDLHLRQREWLAGDAVTLADMTVG